jgi:sterol 3beta-glucosyltransferase
VRQNGLDFSLVELNPRAFLQSLAGRIRLERGNPLRFVHQIVQLYAPLVVRTLDEYWQASQGAEAIVFSPGALGGLDIAEKLGVPAYLAGLQPYRRSRYQPAPCFPHLPLGPVYNRLTHAIGRMARGLVRPLQAPVNRWRVQRLGLPARSIAEFLRARDRIPTLYGVSPTVAPGPPDWPAWVHVTGYWFLDRPEGWHVPPELDVFLAAGPPPVYVGFGSMRGRDPAVITAVVVEALRRAGQRGVLLTGWGGLDRIATAAAHGAAVLAIDAAPHDWLFPRMAAVFHHGGAGTAAAGLRAGVPSAAVPFFADQPYWGAMLANLGVGPAPIPQRRLTAARLADAIIRAVTDTGMRARAAAVGEQIRAENGVETAVALFHHHLPRRGRAMAGTGPRRGDTAGAEEHLDARGR